MKVEFTQEEITAVTVVLKKYFTNLSVDKVLEIAFEILRSLNQDLN